MWVGKESVQTQQFCKIDYFTGLLRVLFYQIKMVGRT